MTPTPSPANPSRHPSLLSPQELKRMKNETAARTDNDLLDDVMEDGTSLADARAAKAQVCDT